jgi:hypothetical protein
LIWPAGVSVPVEVAARLVTPGPGGCDLKCFFSSFRYPAGRLGRLGIGYVQRVFGIGKCWGKVLCFWSRGVSFATGGDTIYVLHFFSIHMRDFGNKGTFPAI